MVVGGGGVVVFIGEEESVSWKRRKEEERKNSHEKGEGLSGCFFLVWEEEREIYVGKIFRFNDTYKKSFFLGLGKCNWIPSRIEQWIGLLNKLLTLLEVPFCSPISIWIPQAHLKSFFKSK